MHLLLIHQNFPGQFRDLAPAWLARGHRVTALGSASAPEDDPRWDGLTYVRYRLDGIEEPSVEERGHAVAEACRQLQQKGLVPDLVMVHTAWGESQQLREVFPTTPLVVFPELWGHGSSGLWHRSAAHRPAPKTAGSSKKTNWRRRPSMKAMLRSWPARPNVRASCPGEINSRCCQKAWSRANTELPPPPSCAGTTTYLRPVSPWSPWSPEIWNRCAAYARRCWPGPPSLLPFRTHNCCWWEIAARATAWKCPPLATTTSAPPLKTLAKESTTSASIGWDH